MPHLHFHRRTHTPPSPSASSSSSSGSQEDKYDKGGAVKSKNGTTPEKKGHGSTPLSSFPPVASSAVSSAATTATRSAALGSYGESTLKHTHVWDVVIPPPSDTLLGSKLVPSKVRNRGRSRKISVEVHRMKSPADVGTAGNDAKKKETKGDEETGTSDEAEKCIVRIMKPPKKKKSTDHHGRRIEFGHARRSSSSSSSEDDDDDDSVMSAALDRPAIGLGPLPSGMETPPIPGFAYSEADGGGTNEIPNLEEWTTRHELQLRSIKVTERDGRTVKVLIRSVRPGAEGKGQSRKVLFRTDKEAKAFYSLMDLLERTRAEREAKALQVALGDVKLKDGELGERARLLIEVVSCWDLPAMDITSSDPYVVVRAGSHELHRTKHIAGSLNPIFTVKTNSLFILSMTVKKLFESDGIIFEVKDFDKFRGDDSLGAAIVSPKTLYESHGERMEFKLKPLLGEKVFEKGHIAIRCRHATDHDVEVINALKNGKDLCVDNKALSVAGASSGLSSTLKKHKRSNGGETQYRVMPGPDPRRSESTKWMTASQIQQESMKVSQKWVAAGSGKLGKVFLEIIGCDGLPNLDHGPLRDKTDSFVTVVYEDTCVRTDVVSDCLSPRWLPWTQRAFLFNMMHSSSQIFLSVADYDSIVGNDHDIIGRTAVNLSTLYPNTEYFLEYELYDSEHMASRKMRGKISFRVMIKIEDERQFLLSNLSLPPTVYVNVKERDDFRLVRYTCSGKQGKDAYGRRQINEYVEELLTYYRFVLYYVRQGFANVLFWRGHFPVSIQIPKCSKIEFQLPLNSVGLFIAGVCIVEKPYLLPSFFFALIGWILSAILEFRRKHPNPWMRCKPFLEFVRILALSSASEPQKIEAGEGRLEAEEFAKQWESQMEESEERARETQMKYQQRLQEHNKELEELGDIDVETKVGSGISLDPLRAIWVPLQDTLEYVVHIVRFIKAVFLWEECFIAFWLCTASYILAFLFAVLPWVFVVRWVLRFLVWTFLGPWMKIVDVYWDEKIKPAWDKMNESSLYQQRQAVIHFARIERENKKKTKVYRTFLFGKYVTKVPILKYGSKFHDVPLPSSTARPISQSKLCIEEAAIKLSKRVGGQQLVGDMIPIIESEGTERGNDKRDIVKASPPTENDPLLSANQ